MNDAMTIESHHVVAARQRLSQLWLKSKGRDDSVADLNPPPAYQELTELAPEARDVLRHAFRAYSSEGEPLPPWPEMEVSPMRSCQLPTWSK